MLRACKDSFSRFFFYTFSNCGHLESAEFTSIIGSFRKESKKYSMKSAGDNLSFMYL